MTSNILATLANNHIYFKHDTKPHTDLIKLKKQTEAMTKKVNAKENPTQHNQKHNKNNDEEENQKDNNSSVFEDHSKNDLSIDAHEAYKKMMASVNLFKSY
ncbi:MAG: hypothetical protein ATN31_06855 [Candidatus Epulonipiscioides saccharophilum]|nr:MAG: hypothetical protein ATN31_06855 [Epulopiscium sp. AS2M-Bin001]